MMPSWLVYTPTYTDWYGPGWPQEPPEVGADVVEVEAETRREALVKGVRELRAIRSHWLQDQASDGASPFTGLKAELQGIHGPWPEEMDDEPDPLP